MAGFPAGTIAARLTELGLTLPPVAAPVAAYVPAVRSGRYVHTSGQLPFVDGALPATGKVGDGEGLVAPADAAALARQCACLLYTSPSPRDLSTSRMPSSA